MIPRYDPVLVGVSVAVAMLASFTALTLARRVAGQYGKRRLIWLLGGGVSMGIGIWSMHFVGMLAFSLPVPVQHDVGWLSISLLVAIAASTLALEIMERPVLPASDYVVGAAVMGAAISTMHYSGMRGLAVPLRLTYSAPLVALSIVIAVVASGAAIWLARACRDAHSLLVLRVASAAVMGVAIAGMHYTGMAAAQFSSGEPHHIHALAWVIPAHNLHWPVILSSVAVLVLTLVAEIADQYFQRLVKSDQVQRAILEAATGPIITTDEAGHITYVNKAGVEIFGYPRDEVTGRPITELLQWPDGTAVALTDIAGDAAGRRLFQKPVELVGRRSGGSRFPVEISLLPIAAAGSAEFTACVQDITDRKHLQGAEDDLRRSERLLAGAEQVAALGSWSWNLQTNDIQWSENHFRLLGLTVGAVVPTLDTYLNSVDLEDHTMINDQVERIVRGDATTLEYDQRIIWPDGTRRILHARGELLRDAQGRPLSIMGTSQDVTEVRALDAARQRSEKTFRDFVETTNEWVWSTDREFTLTYSNPAIQTILGWMPDEMVGRHLLEYAHPGEDMIVQELKGLLASGNGWTGFVRRWRHKNGTYRYLESNAVPVYDPQGFCVGFRGSDRDITERREAEQMKSDFVSFVSHQLRTPLSGMKWMLELTTERTDLPDEARDHLIAAQESADRLAHLVNDLLDIARLESGRLMLAPEPFALDELTRSVGAEFEGAVRSKHLNLTLDLAPGVIVDADPQLARQVIANLLSNAVKYTPAEGSVAVAVKRQDGRACWSVSDTGMGIPTAAQSRLFEKFFRAENAQIIETEGTGLGLHLVRLIIEHSGGRVWCESEEGKGSTFSFTLPIRSGREMLV